MFLVCIFGVIDARFLGGGGDRGALGGGLVDFIGVIDFVPLDFGFGGGFRLPLGLFGGLLLGVAIWVLVTLCSMGFISMGFISMGLLLVAPRSLFVFCSSVVSSSFSLSSSSCRLIVALCVEELVCLI